MKSQPPVNFDTVAPYYDYMARLVFGKSLVKAQTYFLSAIPSKSNILILGGGTGWILTEIIKLGISISEITYIDSSKKMIIAAQNNFARYRSKQPNKSNNIKVNFIHGTEEDIPKEKQFDVVVTYFFLDLFTNTELEVILPRIKNNMKKEGIWLFSDFQISGNPSRRLWQKPFVQAMYLFFRWVSQVKNQQLPNYDFHFENNGLRQKQAKHFFSEMIVSRVYKLP